MFFVGATGQLITLILTVLLPLVFLISGHQRIEIQKSSRYLKFQVENQEIVICDNISFDNIFDFSAEPAKNWVEKKDSHFQKIPQEIYFVKCKTFYLNYPGNKAPPLVVYLSC